jgi:RimJ/RimL family protein N-acetyltransferase
VKQLDVSVISLERIRLEPLSLSHSEGMFELWSEPRVCEHSGTAMDSLGHPIQLPAESASESDRLIHFWLDRAELGTGFRWAVLMLGTGKFIGAVGFNSLGDCPEYAYHLIPRWWGCGFGAEASRGALDWSFGHGSTRIEVFVSPDNTKSIRLAKSLGFAPTGDFVDDSRRYLLTQTEKS